MTDPASVQASLELTLKDEECSDQIPFSLEVRMQPTRLVALIPLVLLA